MIPHAVTINRRYGGRQITNDALRDAELVRLLLDVLPDRPEPKRRKKGKDADERAEWTCHALCRLALDLGLKLPWRVVDGRYGMEKVNHTWLEIPGSLILDVYPVASLTPGPHLYDWHVVRQYEGVRLNYREISAELGQIRKVLQATLPATPAAVRRKLLPAK